MTHVQKATTSQIELHMIVGNIIYSLTVSVTETLSLFSMMQLVKFVKLMFSDFHWG